MNASGYTNDELGGGFIKEPLAIVSVACRLPGAENIEEFWDLLISGRSAIGPLPDEIVQRDIYLDRSRTKKATTYSDVGAITSRRLPTADRLGLNKDELNLWDECHLQFADVALDAWNSLASSVKPEQRSRCGIYVGHSGGVNAGDLIYSTLSPATASWLRNCPEFQQLPSSIQEQLQTEFQSYMQAHGPRSSFDVVRHWNVQDITRLVGQVTKTNGPQMAIESACASSSVALCLAALSLQANQIDMAIVGGASYNKVDSLILFSQAQSCSSTDSRPFDDEAGRSHQQRRLRRSDS